MEMSKSAMYSGTTQEDPKYTHNIIVQETAEIEYFNESDAKTAAEALDGETLFLYVLGLKIESLPMKANLIEQGEDDG